MLTEEEKKIRQREAVRRYRERHKEAIRERRRLYYEAHRDECIERKKKYYNEHKEELIEYTRTYHKNHKESEKVYRLKYYLDHKEQKRNQHLEWTKTPIGRATNLLNSYNTNDKKYNRGKGDLTPEWIVENIFTKPCAHCGETDWHKLGCNRLDNSKPHTKDNVEPCCPNCNKKLPRKA